MANLDETADIVEKAFEVGDIERNSEYMAEVLMDDTVSSYKMFEELASDYLNGSEDFRRGMDAALIIVTGRSIKTISQTVIEKAEKG